MSLTSQQLSWQERAEAYDMEQDNEDIGANTNGNEINVMWASSQGGCGPLKRLLRTVEESALPSPTHQEPLSLPDMLPIAATSVFSARQSSPMHGLSQSSASSTSSRSSSSSSLRSATEVSSRHPRRTRSTLSRAAIGTAPRADPSLSGGKSGSQSVSMSHILSRVSRSLNEKAFGEYTLSQQKRVQQTQALKRPPFGRRQSEVQHRPSHSPPSNLTLTPSMAREYPLSTASTLNAIAGPSSTSSIVPTSYHTTAVTASPCKTRIKALLETIDHAEPFSDQSLVSVPAGSKHMASSRPTRDPNRGESDVANALPSRKTPALGMRRPVVLQSAFPGGPGGHAASAVLKLPPAQGTKPTSPTGKPPAPLGFRNEKGPDLEPGNKIGLDADTNLRDHEIATAQHGNKSRGYRRSDPASDLDPPATVGSEMLPQRDKGGKSQVHGDTQAKDGHCSGRHESAEDDESEDAHVSSDGASSGNSSYGDIDIDPAALEEVCKAYDA